MADGRQAHRPDEEPEAEDGAERLDPRPAAELLALAHDPEHFPTDVRDATFTIRVRGYDRAEVDEYVKRTNRLVAELEVTRSPQNAVKQALDRVGEQSAGVLERAREAAEELTSTALAESEHATRRARVEAGETVERAQAESKAMREQAAEEAEELLTLARNAAAEQISDAERQIAAAREEARDRLDQLQSEIASARLERRRVLDQLLATAGALERFAREPDEGGDGEPPAQGRRAGDDPDGGTQAMLAVSPPVPDAADTAAAPDPPTRQMPERRRVPRTPKRQVADARIGGD